MIALLGGTFDPIHNGHLYIAHSVLTNFAAQKIIFIPNHTPPHRSKAIANTTQRTDMLKLALQGHSHFELSDIELERPGPSYMIDTVIALKSLYPQEELGLILGFDAYCHFNTWLHWQKILAYCKLIVVNRQHTVQSSVSDHSIVAEQICKLDIRPCPISATQIRNALVHGKSIDGLVPDAVKHYILKHKLYIPLATQDF